MDTPNTPVLGIYVGPDTVDAVLVRRVGDRYEPLQRFTRPRSTQAEPKSAEAMAAALPGLSNADDYTLQVGGAWSSAAPASAGVASASSGDGAGPLPTVGGPGRPFAPALKDILGECTAAGYPDVPVAFCLTAPEVGYVEVLAPAADAEADAKKGLSLKGAGGPKKRVADKVLGQVPGADVARIVTVPLAGDGPDRVLALAVETADPVTATIEALADNAPNAVRLDAEATLLASVLSRAPAAEGERALVVRVGAEDTLVLFFEGAALAGVERLRSLTAYDLPETIVSRVLLRLDEKKLGDPDTVYVTSTGRTELLLGRFADFFSDAAVEPLGEALAGLGVDVPQGEDAYRAGPLVAAAAAARELSDWEVTPDVQLLPAKLLKRRRALPFAWHTALAAAVLVGALAFAGVRYVQAEATTEALREDLRLNPPVLPDDDPDLLQARVDSLNQTYATYTRSLDVLDSLLVGSDQWTQTMRLVTRSTVSTDGTWLLDWSPEAGGLRLVGQSVSRPQIVEMARRLDGIIEALEYTDIGPRRVYTFDMVIPVPNELPQVALYLREVRAGTADSTRFNADDFVIDPTGSRARSTSPAPSPRPAPTAQ